MTKARWITLKGSGGDFDINADTIILIAPGKLVGSCGVMTNTGALIDVCQPLTTVRAIVRGEQQPEQPRGPIPFHPQNN